MWSIVTWTSFASPHAFAHGSNQASYEGTKCTQVIAVKLPLSQRPLYLSGPANENGAVAPAAPSAAAPTAPFLSSSRLLSWPLPLLGSSTMSGMNPPFPSLAECAAGEAGDEPIEQHVVDECERDAHDEDRGHDPRPVVFVAADQAGRHADRERAVRRARDECDRVDELVDDERECEDDDRQDPGNRDRKDDAHERADARAAVDERRVLELLRDRLEESHEQPDRERDRERRVDDDERPEAIAQVQVLGDDARERQEQKRRRELLLGVLVGCARDDLQVGARRACRERDVQVVRVVVGRGDETLRTVEACAL